MKEELKPIEVKVNEDFLSPKTIGNINENSIYRYVVKDIPNQYYERFRYENS